MELEHFKLIGLAYLILIMWAAHYGYNRSKNEIKKASAYSNLVFVNHLNKWLGPILLNF